MKGISTWIYEYLRGELFDRLHKNMAGIYSLISYLKLLHVQKVAERLVLASKVYGLPVFGTLCLLNCCQCAVKF